MALEEKRYELDKVTLAARGMQIKIYQRMQDIERLEKDIEIQNKRVEELKKEIEKMEKGE